MLFLGLKINEAKTLFFDKKVVKDSVEAGRKRALSRAGAFVRQTMKRSIRSAKKKTADPGRPPKSKTGLLKKFIFFVYEPRSRSVIIGPAELNTPNLPGETDNPLETLEYGGRVKRRIAFVDEVPGETKGEKQTIFLEPIGDGRFRVTGTRKLHRPKKLQLRRTRKAPLRDVDYAPHPFVEPALETEREKGTLENVWADSIR